MPRISRRSDRRRFVSRRRSTQPPADRVMVLNQRLRELIDVQRTQQPYQTPRIPDARPKSLSRHHVVSVQRSFSTVLNFSAETSSVILSHSLLDLPDAAAFSAIFDRYRIDQVQVTFNPPTGMPILTAIDVCPSNETLNGTFVESDLLEYDTVQIVNTLDNSYIQRTYSPAFQLLPYSNTTNNPADLSASGVNRGYMSTDINAAATRWNSLLFYAPGLAADTSFTIIVTYLLNFIASK
jgi:hypothetical protein